MATPDLQPGAEFDGYRILGVLGQGGMGIVYKAEDVDLSRAVALKMIDPKLARNDTFVRRFRAEARALARIQNTHIVAIHALRKVDPYLFIVMEYVDGGTLKDRMTHGALTWKAAAPIIRQMLRAFEAAHSMQIVHRDIKPSNIMLTQDGTVKVTDFGLAKLQNPGSDATVTQGIAGTLFYMSPEQAQGSPALDHRSDLYSLGVTIYEMLAGSLPYDRSSGEYAILKAIVEEPLPPLHTTNPMIPKALSDIVAKALAKDPDDRYQSAHEMLRAFQAYDAGPAEAASDDETVVATPIRPDTATAPSQWFARPMVLGSVAGVLGLVVAVWLALGSGFGGGDTTAQRATLQIASTPEGATVLLDGTPAGTTPVSLDTLAPGTARVRLELEGYEPWDEVVSLRGGTPASLHPTLTPLPITLTITSSPSGATAWLNGEERGQTPLALSDLSAGIVNLRLTLDGYEPWEETMTLHPGIQEPIEARLNRVSTDAPPQPPSRPPATLAITVQPAELASEVQVEVDGNAISNGAVSLTPDGEHRLRCTHPVYGTGEAGFTGASGSEASRFCFFETEVVISGEWADGGDIAPLNIEIYDADGTLVDQTTQSTYVHTVTLRPGTYRIRASHDDSSIVRVLNSEKTITIAPTVQSDPEMPSTSIVFTVTQS